MGKTVRIAGAAGFWGDTPSGPARLVAEGGIDYLVLDYLAEVTMSILAKAKARDPDAGYATDFITLVMKPFIHEIAAKRIKVVANAGGVNLEACRRALQAVAAEADVSLSIGTVAGDDVMPLTDGTTDRAAWREMFSGAPLPAPLMSANAYLGAFPIAAALGAGADIVVTGRCVDSALALGPLIHEFGWQPRDLDALAGGSLCGHLLECGVQATGGNFTDWEDVIDGWPDMGFPIAEVEADGSFVLTKTAGSAGLVSPLTVGEQLLYEIGDPADYALPDVRCDFRHVTLTQDGVDRVWVEGAKGRAPSASYKVSATYAGGYACIGTFVVAGQGAARKAQAQGEAVLVKARAALAAAAQPDFAQSIIDVVGAESLYGPHARASSAREVVLRVATEHPDRMGAEIFSKEFVGAALSMATAITALAPGRPKPTPMVKLHSFLIDKAQVPVKVEVDGQRILLEPTVAEAVEPMVAIAVPPSDREPVKMSTRMAPLRELAVARSGDKGDKANIGVIARDPAHVPALRAALTPDAVGAWFAHVARGPVERYELPGLNAFNFILNDALGGGGAASLRLDPQGKTYAQQLLDMPVPLPEP